VLHDGKGLFLDLLQLQALRRGFLAVLAWPLLLAQPAPAWHLMDAAPAKAIAVAFVGKVLIAPYLVPLSLLIPLIFLAARNWLIDIFRASWPLREVAFLVTGLTGSTLHVLFEALAAYPHGTAHAGGLNLAAAH
jgi:hypothetical protein